MAEAARNEVLDQSPKQGRAITLLDLVAAIVESGATEAEVVATVTDLVNSGRVKLIGNFQGADVQVG